jgi:hypothetical protein
LEDPVVEEVVNAGEKLRYMSSVNDNVLTSISEDYRQKLLANAATLLAKK